MSALRKIAHTPETLNAGHRQTWLRETLSDESIPLEMEDRLYLTALILHHGDGECFPGYRLIGRMIGIGTNEEAVRLAGGVLVLLVDRDRDPPAPDRDPDRHDGVGRLGDRRVVVVAADDRGAVDVADVEDPDPGVPHRRP